jgi:membrane fusion protein (multidrug efflux system)
LDLARAGSRPEEVQEAEAAVRQAEAKLTEAQSAARQLEASRQRLAAAAQREAATRAGVVSAATLQDRSTLRAPFDGTAVDVTASVGEQVSSQAPILELINPAALRAMIQVPARYRSLARPGAPVSLALVEAPRATVTARIHHLAPGADPDSEMFSAEVWLPAVPEGWRDGMLLSARLSKPAGGDQLLIPVSALFDRAGERYVYALEDGKAHERRVDVAGEDAQHAAIASGLKPGDRIVADGSLSLADGTPIGKPGAKMEPAD